MLSQYVTISLKLLWRKMMKLFFDEHETKKKGSGVLTEKRRNDLRVAGYTSENFFIVLTNKPLIDVFLYSHHSCAWNCIYFVRRNSVLVTHGYTMIRLNQLMRETPHGMGNQKKQFINETVVKWPQVLRFRLSALCHLIEIYNVWRNTRRGGPITFQVQFKQICWFICLVLWRG